MISIVSSTNRPNSQTMKVAVYYKELLDSKGVECQIIDLALLPHDFSFTALYHNKGKNDAFNTFIKLITDPSPEY